MLYSSYYALILISFLGLILGLFVLYKNYRKPTNISFFILSLFSVLWINIAFFEDEIINEITRGLLLRFDYAIGSFFAFSVLIFCLDVTGSRLIKKRLIRYVLYLMPLSLSGLVLFSNYIISGHSVTESNIINPSFGSFSLVYDVLVAAAPILGVLAIILKYRKVSKYEKAKFIYLMIGFFLTVFVTLSTNIIFISFIEKSPNYSLYSRAGAFSLIFLIIFSGYAILKHRLLNLKIIATEVISLALLFFSFIQIFTSSNFSEFVFNSIVFVIFLIFIILLVRSVENEVRRKEELQKMADRLSAANKQLKKLDSAKSEFISIASHQLRTPLTAVKGYVSLILEGTYGNVNSNALGALQKVYISTERLIDLVEDLLNVSRIESGRMQYTMERMNLVELISELHDDFILIAKDKKLNFEMKIDPDLPALNGDRSKLREVISNLVDNALKYTLKGGVKVKAENKNSKIRITISDTGIGLNKEDIGNLFKKFSRGKNTEKAHIGGTGLGLYVGKNIIEAHKGKIWVESDGEGRGSRFIIELPIN